MAATDGCSPERVQALIERFVDAYNREDVAGLSALFDTDHRFFEYFDNIANQQITHIESAAQLEEWERYLAARFALGDRLVLGTVDHYPGYANAAFVRSWGLEARTTRGAGAKLVCDAGRLTRVVMSTAPA
jgi:hypothetical protein